MRTSAILLALALLIPAAHLAVADDAPERPKMEPALEKLVTQLSSDDFRVRENASRELEQMGESARAALAFTAEHDESLEARFRAQQLLRRLDGAAAEPLDEPERPTLEEEGEAERIARQLQKFMERGGDPFFRNGLALGTVEAPGLKLVREGFRGVRLEVGTTDETGKPGEPEIYRGRTLEEIVAAHPELAKHPSMPELESKMKDPFRQLEDMFKGGGVSVFPGQTGAGFESVTIVNGVEVRQTPEQTTVKITEKDENGADVVKEYTGKDLEQIKREHPEIAEKLQGVGGFRFELRQPQIFRGPIRDLFGPRGVVTPREEEGAVLGVRVETPQEALAYHLGFEPGHGALVRLVEPKSQAEALGFQRNDIIVKVNGTEITGIDVVTRLFREAAATNGPLTIDIIRRGKPQTLSR